MATPIKPTSLSTEKWLLFPVPGSGVAMFTFSGFAQFVWGKDPMFGTGGNDSEEQKKWVDYDVTLFVGPHWQTVRQVCPFVVAGGHDQLSPDEADAMGYEVTAIKRVTLVREHAQDAFMRLRLELSTKVRGGNQIDAYGLIPSLAYQVTAIGVLANPIGTEGVFFGQQGF